MPQQVFVDPNNEAFSGGVFADAFAKRIGKTHYSGFRVPPGNIWQAKGRRIYSSLWARGLNAKQNLSYNSSSKMPEMLLRA